MAERWVDYQCQPSCLQVLKLCIEMLMGHGPGKGHALPTSDSASDSSDKSHMILPERSVLRGPNVG